MNYTGSKLALILLLAAFTASVSGYFMGLRQTVGGRRDASSAVSVVAHADDQATAGHVIEAPVYADMSKRAHQPNHAWHAQLSDLPAGPSLYVGEAALTAEEQVALRTLRESRRAFYGAPPVVPHAIDQQNSVSCLVCHGKRTQVGRVSVPQISHPAYTNCLQCHAAGAGPAPAWAASPPVKASPKLDNSFLGATAPVGASRAYSGAPPVIPHAVWMRQNCVSCHSAGGSSAIKPEHAERQNCLQCHATNSALEQRPLKLNPPVVPVAPLPAAALKHVAK